MPASHPVEAALGYLLDNAGRVSDVYLNGDQNLSYQYDATGNRTRITWPEATPFYVTTVYDALNRPTDIKELDATDLATYDYDDLSRRTTVTLGNGTTTSYGYDTQAALNSLAHDLAGTTQDNTWTYGRNQAQEITSHAWSNNAYQWTGYANGTKSYTPNGLNQYTVAAGATLGYDGNGNLSGDGTWTYGYDAGNRLRRANKAGLAASLTYDGLDRMRRTTIAGVITHLLYDGTGLVAEYDGSNSLLRRYVHGPGIDEPLVWYEGSGTTNKTWLYADHQNSIAAAANSAGTSTTTYAYGSYGEPDVTTGIRFRYTGQQWLQELGLYHYKARFYSPALGRFLQTDPVGYQSDLNLYAYVGNNPINRTDPPGLFFLQVVGGAVNAGIGAVASFALGEDITLRNLAIDFAVGAASSGAAGLGKLATLAQITNSGPGKAITAVGGEIYKGLADEKSPQQIGILAAGAGVLNATGAVGKAGTFITQKSGLTIPGNSADSLAANALSRQGFGIPAGVAAGVAIGSAANSLGAGSMAGIPASQSSGLNFGAGAATGSVASGLGGGSMMNIPAGQPGGFNASRSGK